MPTELERELLRAYPEIERVRRAGKRRERAEREWREAILAARASGVSLRVIGEAAGVSHVRILQIVREP